MTNHFDFPRVYQSGKFFIAFHYSRVDQYCSVKLIILFAVKFYNNKKRFDRVNEYWVNIIENGILSDIKEFQ